MIIAACCFAVGIIAFLFAAPRTKSLREEERELLDYFRRKDAADRRGDSFP
jgi:hypothetical protein